MWGGFPGYAESVSCAALLRYLLYQQKSGKVKSFPYKSFRRISISRFAGTRGGLHPAGRGQSRHPDSLPERYSSSGRKEGAAVHHS